MKAKQLIFLFFGSLFLLSEPAFAQHNHMEMPVKKDSAKHEMHDHGSMNGHDMKSMSKPDSMVGMKMHMSHAFSLSLPMNRNGTARVRAGSRTRRPCMLI
jgi:hypothetical protein